jgi:hypothetical protein
LACPIRRWGRIRLQLQGDLKNSPSRPGWQKKISQIQGDTIKSSPPRLGCGEKHVASGTPCSKSQEGEKRALQGMRSQEKPFEEENEPVPVLSIWLFVLPTQHQRL